LDFRATNQPSAKEIINILNQSCLGSLHVTNSLNLGYDILDAHIQDNIQTLSDDDCFSWSSSNDNFEISQTTRSNFRFIDYDPSLGAKSNKQHVFSSDFVKNYIGNNNTSEENYYLYETDDAEELTQRNQYINSLSNCIFKVSGPIGLSRFKIGERILINFKGLYSSFGQEGNTRLGVISAIDNNGLKVNLEILDLGSLFSRSARIADDNSDNFSASNLIDKTKNGFITEDNGVVDDNESTLNTNLIS
jgi:hypothetical protein